MSQATQSSRQATAGQSEQGVGVDGFAYAAHHTGFETILAIFRRGQCGACEDRPIFTASPGLGVNCRRTVCVYVQVLSIVTVCDARQLTYKYCKGKFNYWAFFGPGSQEEGANQDDWKGMAS